MTQLLEHTDLSSDHLDRIVTYSAWESKSLFEALEKKIPGMYYIISDYKSDTVPQIIGYVQESIKWIFSSWLFWAVGAAKKKN